jgi:glyoxylate carboligase
MDLLDALRDSPIHFVMTRHEQGAAFGADVYGRLTGKAGVCLATLGPGATNHLTERILSIVWRSDAVARSTPGSSEPSPISSVLATAAESWVFDSW